MEKIPNSQDQSSFEKKTQDIDCISLELMIERIPVGSFLDFFHNGDQRDTLFQKWNLH